VTTAKTKLSSLLAGFKEREVLALGITQTIGYGTLYYSFGVLAPAIASDFGLPIDWFIAAFTVGLLVGGLAAPLVGAMLDKRGARFVLTIGSACAAAAILFTSMAPNLWAFAAGVILMEAAGCMVLYEIAFGGLTQVHRHEARRRITAVTLVAGFASTIFWPLTQFLLESFGWRWTFLMFAAAHLFVCLPLHWTQLRGALPLSPQPSPTGETIAAPAVLHGEQRHRAIVRFTFAVCVSGIVYSAVSFHMIAIVSNEGFTGQTAALVAMAMGPA
jgi:MFS family permease